MNPWWLGLDPAQATITCGGHAHRLRWEEGALWAVDHEDPEAERALAALGGDRCACVEVLDAWSRHDSDPRVLVLATRGPGDPFAAHANWTAQLGALPGPAIPAVGAPSTMAPRGNFLRPPARRRATAAAAAATAGGRAGLASVRQIPIGRLPLGTRSETELIALLGVGGAVQDRLVATVAHTWARRFEEGDPALIATRPTLHASMHGRLSAVVRNWLGRVDLEVELHLIDARGTPTLTEHAGVVRAELPFAWLAEVWSRGLATVMGRFCLAASTVDGRAWRLTTLGPELGLPAPIMLERPA